MVEVMKIITSKGSMHAVLYPVLPTSSRPPMPLLEIPGHSRASLGQSLVGSLLLSPGSWCTQGSICTLQESISSVLCKFWQLCGGVNDDLLREGLYHTQVCCTQSPVFVAVHCWPIPPQETLRHSSGSVPVGSLGPGAHEVCWSFLSVSGRYGA